MKTFSLKKATAALVVAGALAIGSPVAANAYTPSTDGAVVSGSFVPGGTVTLSFSGFMPFESVTITLTGLSGASLASAAGDSITTTTDADADGVATVTLTLPEGASGDFTVTAVGLESGVTQSQTFTVDTASAAGTGTAGDDSLLATGNDVTSGLGLWVGGGALVLAGGAIVVASAVRKQRETN
ncbi:hypothetical protein [Microbacterium excoecariae]|uniref:hypothetical protein n=1 Tax=Microbacterium excoecariae TaxID=2715210 RepID=UPI001408C9C1|nr:hypothetical protein [Microbacterium excoecariae]NHI17991.1 hypothetical protein [Microbacterium excoecariae]